MCTVENISGTVLTERSKDMLVANEVTMHPVDSLLHDLQTLEPTCLFCNGSTRRFIVRYNNENGNAGRSYHKCADCGHFACFGDMRGVHAGNVKCGCNRPSRLQAAGRTAQVPGALHFTCAAGRCKFFNWVWTKQDGQEYVVRFVGPFNPQSMVSGGL